MSDNGFRLASVAEIIESATRMIRALSPQEILTELKTRPITETLPLVKEWLAGEGYGVLESQIETYDGKTVCSCLVENPVRCPFLSPMGGCKLKAQDNDADPDPSKCPAVLKRAKEGK